MDLPFIITALKAGARYIPVSLFIAGSALLIGILVGLGIALIRFFKVPILAEVSRWFITLLKGIPLVLVLLVIYILSTDAVDFLAEHFNLPFRFKDLGTVWLAILGLSIYSSIALAESFRGAFLAIDQGQFDAAAAIGMTRWQTMYRIILPQAFVTVMPTSITMLVGLVKGTALASMVDVVDILQGAQIAGSLRNLFLESYIAAAIIYWIINALIELAGGQLERRLQNRRGRVSI
ncbi:sulfur-containing amino acid ABC transporter permease TcyM [Pseudolactococcus yaeyamensis]